MYDPDRSQSLTERGEIRPWSAFLAAVKLALEKERPGRGSGLRFLTGTVTSPTLEKQIGGVLEAFPESKWAAWEPAGRDNIVGGRGARLRGRRRAALPFRQGRRDRLARGGLSRERPGDAAVRARLCLAAQGGAAQPPLRGRIDALADGRESGSPPAHEPCRIEAFTVAIAAGVGAIPVQPSADPFVAAVVEDLKAHRGTGLVLAGESQPRGSPPRRPCARARHQPGLRQRRHDGGLHGARPGGPFRRGGLARRAGRRHGGRQGLDAGHRRRESRLQRAGRSRLRQEDGEGRAADSLALYNDETSRRVPLDVAEAHPLESWSDARSDDGTATILQPLIAPLFSGKRRTSCSRRSRPNPSAAAHTTSSSDCVEGAASRNRTSRPHGEGAARRADEGSASPSRA